LTIGNLDPEQEPLACGTVARSCAAAILDILAASRTFFGALLPVRPKS